MKDRHFLDSFKTMLHPLLHHHHHHHNHPLLHRHYHHNHIWADIGPKAAWPAVLRMQASAGAITVARPLYPTPSTLRRACRYVVVIVATQDSDMLVEVIAHPLESKYLSSSSVAADSIITSYACAAATPATPEILKHLESPCLRLCSFIATHCQVELRSTSLPH
jgi:hypothetical protein